MSHVLYVVLLFLQIQDIKTEMNPILNPRAAGPEGSLIGIPGILVFIFLLCREHLSLCAFHENNCCLYLCFRICGLHVFYC